MAKSRRLVDCSREPESGWVLCALAPPARPRLRYCCSSASIVVGRPSMTIVPRLGRPSAPAGSTTRSRNFGSRYRSKRSGGSMMCMSESTKRRWSFISGILLSDLLVGQALDVVHVGALDADEPGRPIAPGGMQVALVVDVGHARLQRIAAHVAYLARLALGRLLHERPVVHQRLAAGLAVDRPRRPVIVRIALAGAAVDVAEDAEAEPRVGVEDLALGHVVAQVPGDERVVLQHVLYQG